jgi:quercetin dioxygenase-like cupin family protein
MGCAYLQKYFSIIGNLFVYINSRYLIHAGAHADPGKCKGTGEAIMTTLSAAALKDMGMNNGGALRFEDLLSSQLDGVDGTEVIVSITTVPPQTTLPKHWHPGEEFAYVLEGSFVLWQEGRPDELYQKGDVGKVPLKQVHTVSTQEEGATILIFRIHETGQPGRIPVE